MASIKDLKKRITSTKNTQLTTKAMKMVSAAYLRRAQDAILNQRPYAKKVGELLKHFLSMSELGVESPLLKKAGEVSAPEGQKRLLLVVVTSDRGLCAGFNSSIIRMVQRWVAANQDQYARIELAFLGRRGYDFFKTKKYNIGTNFAELGGKVTFLKARKLSEALVTRYLAGEFDEVKIAYNVFKNAVSQIPTLEDFLPLTPPEAESGAADSTGMMLVEPNAKEMLEQLLRKHFPIQAFRIMLESQAGEHGARMSAMENATKNAGEMILGLTLEYNKQRQAAITKELLEIIAGSESQKAH